MRPLLVLALLAAIGGGSGFILTRGGPGPEGASAAAPVHEPRPAASTRDRAHADDAPAEAEDGGGLLAWFSGSDARAALERKDVYYQWVDDAGSVHFVRSLDEVPAAWRDRAGRIEVDPKSRPPTATRTLRRTPSRPAARPAARAAATPEVVVYTTSWCGWCRKTLAWLDQQGVDYVNKDIERDDDFRDELIRKTGRTSIPVVDIDGEIVRGYDPGRMGELLRAS